MPYWKATPFRAALGETQLWTIENDTDTVTSSTTRTAGLMGTVQVGDTSAQHTHPGPKKP